MRLATRGNLLIGGMQTPQASYYRNAPQAPIRRTLISSIALHEIPCQCRSVVCLFSQPSWVQRQLTRRRQEAAVCARLARIQGALWNSGVPAERRDFVLSRRLKICCAGSRGGSMTRKLDSQEPLLNAVARKLGRAAGTLANMTHILTTEPATRELRSPSKPESVSSGSAGPKPENQEEGSASPLQNRTKKHGPAPQNKRAARSGTASRKNSIGTKSSSRRKG
jgi:hypothetical protein